MNDIVDLPIISQADAMSLFKAASTDLRKRRPLAVLEQLGPILEGGVVEEGELDINPLLWGLLGDAFFLLGKVNEGVHSYRRSIELDPLSSSVTLLAYQVAKHTLVCEAAFALTCLERQEKAIAASPRRFRLLAFIVAPFLEWNFWWFQFVQLPLARRRLKQMAATRLADGP